MEILNLYAGIGGNRTMWGNEHNITAVEYDEKIASVYKNRFPNDMVIVDDAIEYLRWNFERFDFIWVSPPCQSHTKLNALQFKNNSRPKIPDLTSLYGIIVFLNRWKYEGKYVVENVDPYYKFLMQPTVKINRHNYWSNFRIMPKKFDKLTNMNIPRKSQGIKKETSIEVLADVNKINMRLLVNFTKRGKRTLLRNCVDYRVAKYILDCVEV